MHTNVFDFDASHPVLGTDYVAENRDRSYCGVVNIYNFLADSFRYNRNEDEGYLIGRLFINAEGAFFVEGRMKTPYSYRNFGVERIDRSAIISVLESAIEFAFDFDLLVPPYSNVSRATVDQFNTKMENSKFRTGKRLGVEFEDGE